MKFALAQINTTVGDIDGNSALILEGIARAKVEGADVVVFPELAVFGYPPKDLLFRRSLVEKNVAAIKRIASACRGVTAVVGYVERSAEGRGKGLLNAAAVCRDGIVQTVYGKMLLPTYDVFDESRYFDPGDGPCTFAVEESGGKHVVGVTICEDLWNNTQFEGRRVYGVDPIRLCVDAGADTLVNLSASPYRADIHKDREALFASQVAALGTPLIHVNQVGGNDDLLFDGSSLAIDAGGALVARAKVFAEDFLVVDLAAKGEARIERYPDRIEGIRQGLVTGIRDYLRKCRFSSVYVGLSGGVDSAVTAGLAVDALGAEAVRCVAMPSRFSSAHSLEDARRLAENLKVDLSVIPIEAVHKAIESAVAPAFAAAPADASTVAEENIQARIRGNILMGLANKFDALLLTTGNKSELAVGYCTLYGDMCGGLAVLSDVPKTVVYALARHINDLAGLERIPRRTIEKAPTAELRAAQTDQDTLPPYDLLDAILEQYVECDASVEEIAAAGLDRDVVARVADMVDRSEYKRKQAPVGLKVTSRAFGTGRRMPIAAKYH